MKNYNILILNAFLLIMQGCPYLEAMSWQCNIDSDCINGICSQHFCVPADVTEDGGLARDATAGLDVRETDAQASDRPSSDRGLQDLGPSDQAQLMDSAVAGDQALSDVPGMDAGSPQDVSTGPDVINLDAGIRDAAIVCGDAGGKIIGVDWHKIADVNLPDPHFGMQALTWDGQRFWAVGTYCQTWSSEDGESWTGYAQACRDIAVDGGPFLYGLNGGSAVDGGLIAVGSEGVVLPWDVDGGKWGPSLMALDSAPAQNVQWNDLARYQNKMLVVGYGGASALFSEGTWSRTDFSSLSFFTGLVGYGQRWIATGIYGDPLGRIFSSVQGENLSLEQSLARAPNGIFCSATRCIIVGLSGQILRSDDGQNWTAQTPVDAGPDAGPRPSLQAVTWTGSKWVALGSIASSGESKVIALTSEDGLSWHEHLTDFISVPSALASNSCKVVALSAGGDILVSP